METQWTINMLADELLATRAELAQHVQECGHDKKEMSGKLDKVVSTVEGYEKIIAGSWSGAGKIIAGVIGTVIAAVIVLSIQNRTYHVETANKVVATASTLAAVTADRDSALLAAIDKRNADLLAALKHRGVGPTATK